MALNNAIRELRNYYAAREVADAGRSPFWGMLDGQAAAHPEWSALQLKAVQYETIAAHFQPVLFGHVPFYFEMGVKPAECRGQPMTGNAGSWLYCRNSHLFRDANPVEFDQYRASGARGVHLAAPYADAVFHHCFPYPNVVEHGLATLYRRAEVQLANSATPGEIEFLTCAMRGLLAVKRIAETFAAAAEARLAETSDPEQRRNLEWIARTAREVPWRAPRTFHEGLNTVWFLYEVCGSIEGIVSSLLGHLDLTLGELYRRDLEAGCITREEAYDLVSRFLILAESKYDMDRPVKDSVNGQEMATTITLGGCDADGRVVCNEVTFLILEAHHNLKLHFPKIHCRISPDSPPEYLAAINRSYAAGRNTLALLNDEALIAAQIKAGKRLEDARRYVAGGCWEVMIEGCEHSAGASNYFNLLRILDFSIHDHADIEAEVGLRCEKLDGAADFEEVYARVFGNIIAAIRKMCNAIGRYGSVWPEVNPSPFFSACMADCLENRRDYTAGGGRYNPHGLPLAGFANLIDSLLAIQTLCFTTGRHSLAELLTAVRGNWEGCKSLRAEALAAPHYGDNSLAANALARRLLDDIYANTRDLTNERGGPFQLGIYVYKEILWWGRQLSATPDGRRAGDVFEPGLVPSRLRRNDITSTIHSAAALDLSQCPADSLLTLTLPLGEAKPDTLAALERVFTDSGIGMLQLNCVDKDELIDARKHPERHQDLVVRIAGYSVRFVLLEPEWQDEVISRTTFSSLPERSRLSVSSQNRTDDYETPRQSGRRGNGSCHRVFTKTQYMQRVSRIGLGTQRISPPAETREADLSWRSPRLG